MIVEIAIFPRKKKEKGKKESALDFSCIKQDLEENFPMILWTVNSRT